MANYRMMKVFDCTEMPKEVRKVFFETFQKGNDVLVETYCHESRKPFDEYTGGEIIHEEIDDGIKYVRERGDDIISDWLFDNGAEIEEEVIISHWW